jgi:hypothetical protein
MKANEIPTANLVNSVMSELFKWKHEGRLGPTNALLDAELLNSNYPVLLSDALDELCERQKQMPISDCITEEKRRSDALRSAFAMKSVTMTPSEGFPLS